MQTFRTRPKLFFSFCYIEIEHSSTKIELETMLAYGKDQAVHLPPFFAVKKRLKEHHQKISTELTVSENQQKDSYLSV